MIQFFSGVHMLNRASCACLLLAALMWSPSSLTAQEVSVTIGDLEPARVEDGQCPAYISTRRGDAPGGGALQAEENVRTSETNQIGAEISAEAAGIGGSMGGSGTRTVERNIPVGYYRMGDGSVRPFDCRTLEMIET
jgi:hypothetical protein